MTAATRDRRQPVRMAGLVAAGLLGGAALALGAAALLRAPESPPSYRQLTFRRGNIGNARFADDGQTIVYSAAWNGQPARVYATRIGSPESRDLGIEGEVLAISSRGELAAKLGPNPLAKGTLATKSLSGGAIRELQHDVIDADWDAEGRNLAILRVADGRTRLEYPIGRVLYQADEEGELMSLRVLPDGRLAVFEALPDGTTRPYAISIVDALGTRSVLAPRWVDPMGARMGWWSRREGILFTAYDGSRLAMHALSPTGQLRQVVEFPGEFFFRDVDTRGRMLLLRGFPRGGVMALTPGWTQERDLSWLDFSYATDISSDGRRVLLTEVGGEFAETGGIVLWTGDGPSPVLLGSGVPLALSPDDRAVLALPTNAPFGDRLLVVPVGAGQRRELRHASMPRVTHAVWFPDAQRIALLGGKDARHLRVHVWDAEGRTTPRPISPEGAFEWVVPTPDGRFVAAAGRRAVLRLFPTDGGPNRPIPGALADDQPLRWSADGNSLFVRRGVGPSALIERLEASTGQRTSWKVLRPADPAGVFGVTGLAITPDGLHYAYTVASQVGNLYLADGIR